MQIDSLTDGHEYGGMRPLLLLILVLFYSCATPIQKPTFKQVVDSNELKLCFIGDTGTNTDVQRKVAERLRKEKCHSVHFLGDIIYDDGLKNRHDKQFHTKFWDHYGPLTRENHKPTLYMTLGNHDHRSSIQAWRELSQKYPKVFYPYPYYLVKLNENICLTHFDTNYYQFFTNYVMKIAQNKFLTEVKDDLLQCKVKIALAHHPYNSSGKSHGNSKGILRNELAEYVIGKYDYYISGHDHILADEGVVKKTRLLVSGAGGKPARIEDAGYVVLEINKDDVKYNFRKLSE